MQIGSNETPWRTSERNYNRRAICYSSPINVRAKERVRGSLARSKLFLVGENFVEGKRDNGLEVIHRLETGAQIFDRGWFETNFDIQATGTSSEMPEKEKNTFLSIYVFKFHVQFLYCTLDYHILILKF